MRGAYRSEWQDEDPMMTCHRCGTAKLQWRLWESADGGHEDIHYRCRNCGEEWWVDGPDG